MTRVLREADLHQVLHVILDEAGEDVSVLWEAWQIEPRDFLNQVAMAVARLFVCGHRDFHDCDAVMNTLFGSIVDLSLHAEMPEPAFSIYLAFDAGEYRHSGDAADVLPWEQWTRPQLERILREAAVDQNKSLKSCF